MAHIQYVDALVREYMLFRGFSNSLKSFDTELKGDRDKSLRPDKIIDQITHSINTQDLQALRDIWGHLDGHLFNKLEHSFTAAVKKLEQSLLKLYLVTAYVANKPEKIAEFFNKLATELHSQAEWKDWFYFPYCKNPEEHSTYSVCFTKQWQDVLLISLHNFLSTIFQCMPQPTLTQVETEASLIKKLQEDNINLRNRIQLMSQAPTTSTSTSSSVNLSTHQSRISSFNDQKLNDKCRQIKMTAGVTNLNDIISFDIPPPTHMVDDFYIIAQETLNIGQYADGQSRGLKSLIRNISSNQSPVMGRKESSNDRNKKRSGSAGSKQWINSSRE